MSRALVIVALLLAAAPAGADETANAITVTPAEASVSVTILGIIPDGAITADGDRLEIALEGSPAPSALDVKDPTLRRVEIVDGKISLQLSHGSHTTKQIAAGAKVASSTSGLTIAFPRKGMPAITSIAPPPDVTAPAAAAEPAAPVPAAAPPAPAPVAATPPAAPAPPAVMPGIPSSTTSPVGYALAAGLAGVALAAYLFARRKKGEVGRSPLKILATTPMGTRSRLVLVAAGEREMLLAVDSKGVTLIEKWRGEGNHDDEDDLNAPEPKFAVSPLKPASSAVSGLLRLRNGGKERA